MQKAKTRRRPLQLVWLPRVWIAVVGVFLLWQMMSYGWPSSVAAEWQYKTFNAYHPALTWLVLTLILCSPLLLLRLQWRRGRKVQEAVTESPTESSAGRGIRATSRIVKIAFGGAALALLAAITVGAFILMLPSATGPVRAITVKDDLGAPQPGLVELKGRILFGKTAVFNEDLWVARRSTRFAPIVGEGADQNVIHYFVELPTDLSGSSTSDITTRRGILRQGGLPGDIAQLYRYAGLSVDPNYNVLFATKDSMQRAYVTTVIELLVLALFLALGGLLYRLRGRRLLQSRRQAAERTSA